MVAVGAGEQLGELTEAENAIDRGIVVFANSPGLPVTHASSSSDSARCHERRRFSQTCGAPRASRHTYRPCSNRISSGGANPSSALASAIPLSRASSATAAATAGATSRLNTDGMM